MLIFFTTQKGSKSPRSDFGAIPVSFVLSMREAQELQLHIRVQEAQELKSPKNVTVTDKPQLSGLKHFKWWLLVTVYTLSLLSGQSAAILLGRLYYDKGGNSKWMATLVQSAGFPILFIPLVLFHLLPNHSASETINNNVTSSPSSFKLALLYIFLGLLIAGDNMMYSYGLLYLPVSTYSLLCATQLAFNAVISYFLNSQKFTALILNSLVLLTISASLLAVHADSGDPTRISKGKYAIGFLCTLGASAAYALLLSLMQFAFQKVIRKETFSVVLEMQLYPAIVATCACVVGLFASEEWEGLKGEMENYGEGRVSYLMTLVWTAVTWQISTLGTVGLIFSVSALFSNVISTLALPIIPILAVIFFHDKMNGVKVVALVLSVWGFASYIYQHYLDDSKSKATKTNTDEVSNAAHTERG